MAMCSTPSLPATNEGHPPSSSRRERASKNGLALWRASSPQLSPPRAAWLPGWHECPPPGSANCTAGGCLGHTQIDDRGRGTGLLPRGRWGSSPLSCLEGLTLNLFQGPQTSLTTQAPVPFPSCAANPLKPIHCPAALSSSSLDNPEHPRSRGAPLSLCLQWARPASSQTQDPGRSLRWPQKFPLGPSGSPHGCASSPVQMPGLLLPPPPRSQVRGCR